MKPIGIVPITTIFVALTAPTGALAGAADEQKTLSKWAEMRQQAVSASEVLSGQVKNIANPIGQTKHLILNEAKNDVKYVLYETPYPYNYYSATDGFLNYDSLDIERNVSGGTDLIVADDNDTYSSNKLKLTRGDVRDRMVSRLIGREMAFDHGHSRQVEDILIHPKTGKVTHYVVEMNPETLFNENPKTIRAKNVTVSDKGQISTELSLGDLETEQDYDQTFL